MKINKLNKNNKINNNNNLRNVKTKIKSNNNKYPLKK